MAHGAARKKENVVALSSATGLIADFVQKVRGGILQSGGGEEDVYAFMRERSHLTFAQLGALARFPHKIERLSIDPPRGGIVREVVVTVDYRRSWMKAVRLGAPDTCRSMGLFPRAKIWRANFPTYTIHPLKKIRLLLVNFGETRPLYGGVQLWGKEHNLLPAGPYELLALGEHEPLLNEELCVDESKNITVLSLSKRPISNRDDWGVELGWWYGKRKAWLYTSEPSIHSKPYEWFVFHPS